MEDKYIKIRKRLNNLYDTRYMSDKDMIEKLDEEIEEYRNRIRCLEDAIETLKAKEITAINTNDNTVLVFTIEDSVNRDIAINIKKELENKTKCKCLILCNDMKLANVLNEEKEDDEQQEIDSDIEEIITTNYMSGGKLVKTITEYKHKDILEETKLIDNKNNVKSILKADIIEYENGMTDILYECDKDRNIECNKKNCNRDCCTHTLDKKYAKNYINNK